MRRALFVGLLLLGTASAHAQTVAPGTTSGALAAEACAIRNSLLCGADCLAVCALDENNAKPSLSLNNLSVGSKWVEAEISTDFRIAPADDGAATPLDATVLYDIGWRGFWTLAGVATGWNDAKASITLTLRDVATDNVVRSVTVHEKDVDGFLDIDIIAVGAGTDRDSSVNSFTARVVRGRNYRLELVARCEAKAAFNAFITLDYLTTGATGAWWNELRVSVAPDLAEQIEELTRRIEALESHTHTYLTGKGEGHNNTEVETSTPIVTEPDSE